MIRVQQHLTFSIVYPFEADFFARILFNDSLILFCVTVNILHQKWMPPFRPNIPPAKHFGTLLVLLAWLQDYDEHFSHQARATPVWKANDANLCYFVPVYLHGYDYKNMIFQLAGVN